MAFYVRDSKFSFLVYLEQPENYQRDLSLLTRPQTLQLLFEVVCESVLLLDAHKLECDLLEGRLGLGVVHGTLHVPRLAEQLFCLFRENEVQGCRVV